MYAVPLILLLSGVGVFGDMMLKRSGEGPAWMDARYFVGGVIIYGLTAFGWFFIMKHVKLATIGVVYSVGTVILLAIVGTLFFRERLNPFEMAGLVLAIASLVLMGRFA